MCKRIISMVIVCSMVFSFTGCKKEAKSEAESSKDVPDIVVVNEIPVDNAIAKEEKDGLDLIGEVDVDRELFDVKITVPKEYVEGETQESLDAKAKESGWKTAKLNEDGSVTYEMSKSQHKKMMSELENTINEQLNSMCGSEDYPSYVSITASDNYTNFKIVTTVSELGLSETISILAFYMYGGMYNIFNGTSVDNIHVDFINEATGEVFDTADSKNMSDD